MCVLLKKLCVSECACVCLTIKRCTVYYVFVKREKMQNPKIKLFYILTVKTIKDIYIMNERERCGLLLCRCSAPLFSVLFFWRGNIKKYPQGILILFPIKTITTALLLSYKDIFHIQAHLRQ